MKKLFFLFTILYSLFSAQAQQVQWASKLIKYSSDLGGKQNGIKRILGKPDAFPQGGSSANAWTPKNALDGKEVVEVGFETPQTVKQVAVFENLNTGCVIKIQVDNGSGSYETVWTRKRDWKTPSFKATIPADHAYYYNRKRRKVQEAPNVAVNAGIEYAILDAPVSGVVAVKVEFSFALIPGQKQIDAIGISDSSEPILAKINTTDTFEKLTNSEEIYKNDLAQKNPALSPDGSKLFFTTYKNEIEIIYYFTKDKSGKWSNPLEADASMNKNENYNYVEGFTTDYLLKGGLAYNRGTGESGYEFLKLTDGKYESIGNLKIVAYNNYDDNSDATITSDGKTLVLGIESDMTQGGTDIYFANRKEDGSYGFLQNAGKTINSAADEGMPFLLSDQKTLLFSSNGFSGYGDYDIFVSHRLDDSWKKWSEPVNLGSKVNTGSFNGSPFYDEKNEILYFTKFIDGKTLICSVAISKVDLTNQ